MTDRTALRILKGADILKLYEDCPDKEAVDIAIKALEQKTISCDKCRYFDSKDNYCSLLQINWLPNDFGCVKGEEMIG